MIGEARIDQALRVVRERLSQLAQRSGQAESGAGPAQVRVDPMVSLRQLVRQGGIAEEDLRKALVRALLSEALGPDVSSSLEFQAVANRVVGILEDHPEGRRLLDRAVSDLDD